MTPLTTVDRVRPPKVTPAADQFEKAVDANPAEALPRIEAARRAVMAELEEIERVRRRAMVSCKDDLGLTASDLAEIIGMPVETRQQRDSSASRVRQILIEARGEFGMAPSDSSGGRPPVYEDKLTREFLEGALASGATFVEIAREVGVGPATVARYADRYGLSAPRRRRRAVAE